MGSRHYNKQNNDRMYMRDMTNISINEINNHGKNMNRILMERNDDMFNKNSNSGDNTEWARNYGEITGNQFEQDNVGRGLPLRSQFSAKKTAYDANEHLDFELYDNRPSKLNVKYSDPTSMDNNTGYADISSSMVKMSSQINPITMNSIQIDRLNNNLFYYLFDAMSNNNYIINGFGLYDLFGSLYLASKNMSEVELKKFFEFPNKNDLYDGLSKIHDTFESLSHIIKINNFLIIGNDVPYNPHFYDNIREFCTLVRIDTSQLEKESNKLNTLIKKVMGTEMRNVIVPENLHKLQLMFLTTSIIHPIWNTPFDKITSGTFYGNTNDIQCNYLHSVSKGYGYFEDNEHQMLEIKCSGGGIVMGFLLHKNDVLADVDDRKIHFYATHMKESILDEVKIPMFNQNLKMRFNNSFKNMGLKTVFLKIISPDFFPEGVVLHDIIQNIKIVVDNSSVTSNDANRGYRTIRKFIADKPFIYYFILIFSSD